MNELTVIIWGVFIVIFVLAIFWAMYDLMYKKRCCYLHPYITIYEDDIRRTYCKKCHRRLSK